jgi:hypothetical protein
VIFPHPIQDGTDDEMRALADTSLEPIWRRSAKRGLDTAIRSADYPR